MMNADQIEERAAEIVQNWLDWLAEAEDNEGKLLIPEEHQAMLRAMWSVYMQHRSEGATQ